MIVRANNKGIGALACEALGKGIGGKGKVLSLMGDQATTNGRDRTTGFNECMKAKFPDVTIIEKPTYWKADKATAEAQTIVTTTPDLKAIYMQSDSVMLAGVLNVLKSAGKQTKVGEPNHIFLATVDGTPFALDKIVRAWSTLRSHSLLTSMPNSAPSMRKPRWRERPFHPDRQITAAKSSRLATI